MTRKQHFVYTFFVALVISVLGLVFYSHSPPSRLLGLKVIAQKFPLGLTTGSIPASCLPSPTGTMVGRKRSTPRQVFLPAERKWRFSSDDLAKIQHYLEEMLVPTNPNSKNTLVLHWQ